jgi:ribonuclease I
VDIILLLYTIVAGIILFGGLFLMWSTAADPKIREKPWHPMADGGPDSKEFKEYMRKVTKRVHPEMQDVEPGTELMGVTFDKPDSCSLEEYRDLQARIDELRSELEGDDEEDEVDDGGDVIISRV